MKFVSTAIGYLGKIQEQKWTKSHLELLKFENIKQLIIILDEFKPKSLVRDEKRMMITYLEKLLEMSYTDVTKNDILSLRKHYIIPILNYKLDKYGYRIAGAWIYSLIFVFPIDIGLIYFFGKIFFYIPIFSIIAIIEGLRKDFKAKRSHRLW